MEVLTLILEVIGTVAFSISGTVTAIKKNMDMFGSAILGLVTAVGGGITRDVILGQTPPRTFQDPLYAVIALAVAIVVFIVVGAKIVPGSKANERILFFMDTLGLGAFTVAGMGVALAQPENYSAFLVVFCGVISGVGGGLLRDIMAGNTPYIFVKHIYACASILGAMCVLAIRNVAEETLAMVVGMAVIVVIRCLSAHYKWNLPHAEYFARKR